MDVVTHAMTGLIFAAPLAGDRPLTAAAFVFGSVLPDLDAFARLGGKRAFLQWHQTFTHGVPAVFLAGLVGTLVGLATDPVEITVGIGLATGVALHAGLDLANTYGVALFAPFSSRRYCTETVFFIDSVVLLLCIAGLGAIAAGFITWQNDLTHETAACFGLLFALYLAAKAAAREIVRRRMSPAPDSLVPSALIPWLWFAYRREGSRARLSRVDLFRGESSVVLL